MSLRKARINAMARALTRADTFGLGIVLPKERILKLAEKFVDRIEEEEILQGERQHEADLLTDEQGE